MTSKKAKPTKKPTAYQKIKKVLLSNAGVLEISEALSSHREKLNKEQAIKLSILHWEQNEYNKDTKNWSQENTSSVCALCRWACGVCSKCPLDKAGHNCNRIGSFWWITNYGNKKPLLRSLRSLLKTKKSKGD